MYDAGERGGGNRLNEASEFISERGGSLKTISADGS